jgi:lipid A oxidase
MRSIPSRLSLTWLAAGALLAAVVISPANDARLRLPFDLFPGAVYLAFLGAPILSRHTGEPDRAPDLQLAAYSGPAYTMRSGLRLIQPGGTDLKIGNVAWEGQPFRAPPYYGLRAIYWLPGSRLGVMGDFTHIKAIAVKESAVGQSGLRDGVPVRAEEPLSATFKRLEFTHGYNLLTVNLVRRGSAGRTGLIPYAGAGLGLAYPHVEVQRATAPQESRTYAYQIAGPVIQVLGGIEWRFGRRLSLFVEYKLSCAAITGDLVGGGTIATNLCTHQFLAGPAFHIRPRDVSTAP